MSVALVKKEPSTGLVVAAFAAVYIIWGSTYTAMLFAIQTIPPFFMAGARFLVAGLIMYIWFRSKGEPTPSMKDASRLSVSGTLMLFFGTGAVAWSEQYMPSGLVATIIASTPIWFVILDKKSWKFNFSNPAIIAGLLIGFVGVLTLFSGKGSFDLSTDKMKLISVFVIIFGTISWATGSLYSKYTETKASPGMRSAVQMFSAGAISILGGFIAGEHHRFDITAVSTSSLTGLIYLIFIGSLVGFTAYTFLLSARPPAIVGTYAYVNPVVAIFLGWLLANEPISGKQLIALAIILGGVIMINLSSLKKSRT